MLKLDQAEQMVASAEKEAKSLGVAITTCVVDCHGKVLLLRRMDGALVVSPDFAQTKAYTSAVLKIKTSDLGEYAQPSKPYYGLNSLFGGELTSIAGGVPVMDGDKVVGAVGVGGSADVGQDEQCALAATEAYKE